MKPLVAALAAAVCAGAMAAPAQARVALVATGAPELALLDISTDAVVARIAMPYAVQAVAVSADGRRGYAAAGTTILALDVNERTELARGAHGSQPIVALALSPTGAACTPSRAGGCGSSRPGRCGSSARSTCAGPGARWR